MHTTLLIATHFIERETHLTYLKCNILFRRELNSYFALLTCLRQANLNFAAVCHTVTFLSRSALDI